MKINLAEMYVDDEMREAATRILNSKRYIKGPEVDQFEKEFSEFCGVSSATAVSSGTTALFTGYMALGIKPGDEVIVPSHTFIASITPAVVMGAKPVFVDVDPETYTMNPEDVKAKITPKTKCITTVHIYGHPSDMDPLMELSREHDIPVIEDSCQAHGSIYKDRRIGSIGTMACFSFFPSKNMTVAGDGGMVTTTDAELGEKLSMLRNHGRTDAHTSTLLGLNFRMSELHAAIGRIQLKHIADWIEKRRWAAETYNKHLEGISGIIRPIERDWAKHVYHLYVVQLDNRDQLMAHLRSKDIGSGIHYPKPVHKQPAMDEFTGGVSLPVTEKLVDRIVSLPLHPELTEKDIATVCDEIRSFIGKELE